MISCLMDKYLNIEICRLYEEAWLILLLIQDTEITFITRHKNNNKQLPSDML